MIGLTVEARDNRYAMETYLLTARDLPPFEEVLKPEAGPEFTGYVEYTGCNAMTGAVLDRTQPDMAPAVELYDGEHLIGARVARAPKREDGTFSFGISVPQRFVADGGKHFLNVRYAGTSTVIGGVYAELTCSAGS